MLAQFIKSTYGLSDGYSKTEKYYLLTFYICIGLLPGYITLFGSKMLHTPFILIGIVTFFYILLDRERRISFLAEMKRPWFLLLVIFLAYMSFYAIWGVVAASTSGHMRIVQKPIALLLMIFVLGFVIANPAVIKADRLVRYLNTGVIFALILVMLVTLWQIFFFDGTKGVAEASGKFLQIHKINRGLEVVSVLAFFAGISLSQRWRAFRVTGALVILTWGLSFAVLGAELHTTGWAIGFHVDSETVQFGIPIALLVFVVAHRWPVLMTDLVFGTICLLLLCAPWLFQIWYQIAINAGLPKLQKFLVRAEIWDGVSRKIVEAPWFGFGIDSLRYLNHISLAQTYFKPDKIWHPHNMFLQIWLDLGFFGALIVCALIVCGWRFLRTLDLAQRPYALAGLVMLSLFSLVTHSIWQTWSLSLMAVFFIILAVVKSTGHHDV